MALFVIPKIRTYAVISAMRTRETFFMVKCPICDIWGPGVRSKDYAISTLRSHWGKFHATERLIDNPDNKVPNHSFPVRTLQIYKMPEPERTDEGFWRVWCPVPTCESKYTEISKTLAEEVLSAHFNRVHEGGNAWLSKERVVIKEIGWL